MRNKIMIWGTGKRTEGYLKKNYFDECDIVGFIDTYRKDNFFQRYPVYKPEEIPELIEGIDYLIIVNQFFMDVLGMCMDLKIDGNKIVLTDTIEEPYFRKLFDRLEYISKPLYEMVKSKPWKLVKANEFDAIDADRRLGRNKYSDKRYERDYFRYRTFEYMAKEILNDDVQGAIAEFGVFRGEFSSIISDTFRERTFYLFDTFEGFEKEEATKELAMGRCNEDFISGHADTSVERMLKNIPHPEQCIICKGFFPDSITQEAMDEKYAFVSIDVDFEESSYQGLKFFYPRLSEGGAIFLHDYHTCYLEGVQKAVKRFEIDFKVRLKKIPLADRAGTLVILK